MNRFPAVLSDDSPATNQTHLLLVEDEHSYAAFLQELLAEEYTVEVTSNGEQAWAAVRGRLPDLILADVQMPLLDGLGLTRRLRTDPRTAGVPIVLMTASNRPEMLLAGREVGMDDFLVKPFHPLKLLARLRCQRRMAPTDLHDCLGQALTEYREAFAEKALHLTVNLRAEYHQVMGNANRLRQMFGHLLRYAGHFTPEQGAVTVHSANDGEDIVVEVIDTGLGIAPEVLPKIFLPFEHGDAERERTHGSLGRGLTVAHAIVTAHGGQLTAASAGLNQGATFRMCLNTKKHSDPIRVL